MRIVLVMLVVSSLTPIIASSVVSNFVSKSRKAEAQMDSVNFVVREPKATAIMSTLLIIIGCAMVAGFLYLFPPESAFWSSLRETGIGMTILMGFSLAFAGLLVLGFSIGLMDNHLIYYPYFKKRVPFDFKEITKVEVRAPVYGYGQIEIFGYSNTKRLFHVDSTNPGFTLLMNKLRQGNVPIVLQAKRRK